jgi:hypothetical protein
MSAWTVTITPLGNRPAQGDRGKTHRVVAVHSGGARVIRRDLTTVEADRFDPDREWAETAAAWKAKRS